MSARPVISVIVPSFNQGQFLKETLDSLISQRYENLELIVIDGGSKDNSPEIIRSYSEHLAYWVSEPDSGQSEAINKGFAKASGSIITWLNSDDVYELGTLHYVADAFVAEPTLGILHGKSTLFGEGAATQVIGLSHDLRLHEYLPYMRFPQPSSFIRRQALDAVLPVNKTLHYSMDFELVVKLLLRGAPIRRSDRLLARYRLHASSKSNHNLAFVKEWSQVVANIFCSFAEGETYLGYLCGLGLAEQQAANAYPVSVTLTRQELEDVFLLHLNLCYHSYYRECDRAKCTQISHFIRTHYSSFYKSNNYRKYQNRLKFIPNFVFGLIRSA